MEKIEFEKYSTEELREMLKQLVIKLTEKQSGEVLKQLNIKE